MSLISKESDLMKELDKEINIRYQEAEELDKKIVERIHSFSDTSYSIQRIYKQEQLEQPLELTQLYNMLNRKAQLTRNYQKTHSHISVEESLCKYPAWKKIKQVNELYRILQEQEKILDMYQKINNILFGMRKL